MGKGSSLRKKEPDYPYVARDGNGKKLPYDPDRVPDGLDDRIWNLALYFEQKMEENKTSCVGRPILYVALSRRLDNYGRDVLRSRARSCGLPWEELVEYGIDVFFNTHSILSIDHFCQYAVFDYCIKYVIDTIAREQLLNSSIKIVIPKQEKQPSKRTAEQEIRDRIRQQNLTEEEMQDKMKEFRRRKD